MMKGTVIKGLSSFYEVSDGVGNLYSVRARGKLKQHDKIYIGDYVEFDEKELVITKIFPREVLLKKPPISNIDQAIVVFSCREPQFHYQLLSKFLLVVEKSGLQHIKVCITKWDLMEESEKDSFISLLETVPYPVIYTSSVETLGVDQAFLELLRGHKTVLTGPSGVGKSSLLNSLYQDLSLEVGGLSQKISRGKHTTRHVELLNIDEDTYIADTPGFSLVELKDLTPLEIQDYFIEFRPFNKECYYTGCMHLAEPQCAVKKALSEKQIPEERYKAYESIVKEVKEAKSPW